MKNGMVAAAILAAIAFMTGVGRDLAAHGVKAKTLDIVHPWAYETDGGVDPVEVYLRVKSRDRKADRLVSASSPRATRVELQGPKGGPGQPLASIEIKPGATVDLSPSGPRLVLHGLGKAMNPYDTLPMTLVFERVGRIEVEVLIEEKHAVVHPPAAAHPIQNDNSKEKKQ